MASQLSGDQPIAMLGYYRNEDATRVTIESNESLHIADIAAMAASLLLIVIKA
jgi:long-subunit acyl-CoA synthetase (AMP-forming)